jgi:hypothetical protein
MRVAALGIALIILSASPAGTAAPRQDVASLAWMGGEWVEEKEGGWTQEIWSRPRGGVMLGTSLTGRGERAGDYEFIRIAAGEDGTPTYFASPRGAAAVPFRLISASPGQAVFENPKHDFPTRIAYRREGDVLTATVSGPYRRR